MRRAQVDFGISLIDALLEALRMAIPYLPFLVLGGHRHGAGIHGGFRDLGAAETAGTELSTHIFHERIFDHSNVACNDRHEFTPAGAQQRLSGVPAEEPAAAKLEESTARKNFA